MSQLRSPARWRVRRVARELGLIALLVVLPGFVLLTFVNHLRFIQNHDSAAGTVIEKELVCGGHWCGFETTVNFVTATGRAMQVSFFNEGGQVGESVTVYYSVADPSYATLHEGMRAFQAGGLIVGVIIAWFSVILHFVKQLRRFRGNRRNVAID
jgi:hypothetical protein